MRLVGCRCVCSRAGVASAVHPSPPSLLCSTGRPVLPVMTASNSLYDTLPFPSRSTTAKSAAKVALVPSREREAEQKEKEGEEKMRPVSGKRRDREGEDDDTAPLTCTLSSDGDEVFPHDEATVCGSKGVMITWCGSRETVRLRG
jgi:hypothetical protein